MKSKLFSLLALALVSLSLSANAQAYFKARAMICDTDVGALVTDMINDGAEIVEVAAHDNVCVNFPPELSGYRGCTQPTGGHAVFGRSADFGKKFVIENWPEKKAYTVDELQLTTALHSLIYLDQVKNVLVIKNGGTFTLLIKVSPYGTVSCL